MDKQLVNIATLRRMRYLSAALDGAPMPPERVELLFRVISQNGMLIANAPRPLTADSTIVATIPGTLPDEPLGNQWVKQETVFLEWTGDFVRGRFYAAGKSPACLRSWEEDHATILEPIDNETCVKFMRKKIARALQMMSRSAIPTEQEIDEGIENYGGIAAACRMAGLPYEEE